MLIASFRLFCWALIFIFRVRFLTGSSIATILNERKTWRGEPTQKHNSAINSFTKRSGYPRHFAITRRKRITEIRTDISPIKRPTMKKILQKTTTHATLNGKDQIIEATIRESSTTLKFTPSQTGHTFTNDTETDLNVLITVTNSWTTECFNSIVSLQGNKYDVWRNLSVSYHNKMHGLNYYRIRNASVQACNVRS